MEQAAMYYSAVVPAVLLYGSESWVLAGSVLKLLESSHNRMARLLANLMPRHRP